MSPRRELEGERVAMLERMIVAPMVGVFRPLLGVETGATVSVGEIVGVVEGPGTREPVRSAFDGVVMGVLAHSGERMRVGQPVAWMRVA
jgi:biotin carboxyl carrier protein